jgi:hypothetical protein
MTFVRGDDLLPAWNTTHGFFELIGVSSRGHMCFSTLSKKQGMSEPWADHLLPDGSSWPHANRYIQTGAHQPESLALAVSTVPGGIAIPSLCVSRPQRDGYSACMVSKGFKGFQRVSLSRANPLRCRGWDYDETTRRDPQIWAPLSYGTSPFRVTTRYPLHAVLGSMATVPKCAKVTPGLGRRPPAV